MSRALGLPTESHRDRAAFYRTYYGPLGEHSPHGLAVVDAKACVLLYANAHYLERHGLPPDQELPVACHRVHGLDRPCDGGGGCPAQSAHRAGETLRRVDVAQDGSSVEILARPLDPRSVRSPAGETVVFEKRLGRGPDGDSEEWERRHLLTIVRHSADAIIGLDRDWTIRSWNRGAEELFGYSADEALGKPFDLLVPDGDSSFERQRREFERRGILRSVQETRRARDGREIRVSSTWSMVRNERGEPIGVSIVSRDVTQEVLLRELLEHQHRALSVVLEIGEILHTSDDVESILSLVLIGVTAEQGLGFNRAFLLLVEERPDGDHLVGRLAVGPSDAAEADRVWRDLAGERVGLLELHRRYLRSGAPSDQRVNERVRRIDIPLSMRDHLLVRCLEEHEAVSVVRGRTLPDELPVEPDLIEVLENDTFVVVPLRTREHPVGALIVDNKITGAAISEADLQMLKVFANHASIAIENSRLRASLRARLEELEQLNRKMKESQKRLMEAERLAVIGEMAARVAHEIRNPLVSIGGFARLLRRGIDPDDPRSDYLRIIGEEVARLERIVQELLDFSRPQRQLCVEEVDLNELVDEVVTLVTVEAEESGVRVETRYDERVGRVLIDPDKTKQVLLNVLRNALDAMPDGGLLTVETSRLDEGRVKIRITDSGPGIPEELRQKVFEPGFSTRREGTGFGLAIAKRLVELQGGSIEVCPDVRPGCGFDIVLPVRVTEGPARQDHEGQR